MDKIRHLLDIVDKVRDDVALGLMSDPGLSKTSQVKQWAEENGRRYCELIISQRMPSEISGMPMPVNDTRRMEIFDFETLLELKDGDVLAFDEFTNGNIQTLNACLTLIQERTMLSGKKLPSLVIVAMGNPQGRCEILPQTKQRFWWVTVRWHADTWVKYMRQTWDVDPDRRVLEAIADQYRRGFAAADEWNYLTPRTMENLFRIAKNIRRDDAFWAASDVKSSLVHAIYASIKEEDTYTKLRKRIEQWGIAEHNACDNAEEETALAVLLQQIEGCETSSQLKEFINFLDNPTNKHTPQTEQIVGRFISWLNSTSVNDLEHELTSSDPRPSKLFDSVAEARSRGR